MGWVTFQHISMDGVGSHQTHGISRDRHLNLKYFSDHPPIFIAIRRKNLETGQDDSVEVEDESMGVDYGNYSAGNRGRGKKAPGRRGAKPPVQNVDKKGPKKTISK